MLGALIGGWMASREAKRRGHDPEIVWDLLIYLIIGGVIGARLWHVFTPSPSALIIDPVTGAMVNPYFAGGTIRILDILSIWKGGLGIPGAVIGGAIALYFYTRQNKMNFLEWVDIAAPSLALGQAIGRFGNFFNQELYGAPTNLPWKLFIDPAHRLPGFASVEYYHPLFAYEAILNFANMLLLMWVTRQYEGKRKSGDVLLVYLIFYPLVRFSLDFLRLDASMLGGININQTIMGIIAVLALGTLIWRHRPGSGDDNLAPLTPEFGFILKSEESDAEPMEAEPILEVNPAEEPIVVKKATVKRAPSKKSIDKVETAPLKTPRKTAKPAAQPARKEVVKKPAAKKPPKTTE
jgi:phosphatidylglycerol:prolipoprotein diacylglycerol transferase